MIHQHIINYDYMYYNAKFSENGGIYSGYVMKPMFRKNDIFPYNKMNLTIISGSKVNHSKYHDGNSPFV